MTEPVSNAHAAIESELKCPACGTQNKPLATFCVWDVATETVVCLVQGCGYQGPLSAFLLPKQRHPEGDRP